MECGTSDWVKEESQISSTIKTEEETAALSTPYIEIEINLSHLQHESELVRSVKSEPVVLVKKEIAEDSSEDDSEQQCAQVASTPASGGSLYEANSTSQGDWINVKPELKEIDIGPTVLQHMDIHYALNKSTVDPCNIAMRCSGVKKNVEDKLRDPLTTQEAMKKEWIPVLQSYQHGVQEHRLAVCSVHMTRLNVFQCELCHTVFAEKRQLIRHLQAVHAYCPQAPFNVKFRKTNKRPAADKKATSYNCSQISTEVDYEDTRMKSHLGQQKYLQKHLQQQRTTSSNNGFKCDGTFHKPHLLVERNKLHQRNNRKAVAITGTVAGPSNQSGDKRTKTKQKPFDECEDWEKGYSSKVDLNLNKRSHSKVELKSHLVNYKSHTRKKHHDEIYTKSRHLTKHIRVHTDKKPIQCKVCDAKFAQSGGLTRHMGFHTGEKPFQCKICNAKFAQNSYLTKHMMRVHKDETPFQCKMCDARFAQSNNLTRHLRVHTGEKRFQCKICDARFAQTGSLTRHMRIHTGEKPFHCKICCTKFAESSNLTRHMKIHTGEKSYQCETCDAIFARRGVLKNHMRVHTGEKPFQCKICDAKFAQNGGLTQHMKIHTGEKPFQCKICDVRFAQNDGLTQHIKVHTGEKPFQCKICDARFARKSVLTMHIQLHTGEKPFQCKICSAKYALNSYLTNHLMRVHTGEKPYQCKLCDARFAFRKSLSRHMRVHTGKKHY